MGRSASRLAGYESREPAGAFSWLRYAQRLAYEAEAIGDGLVVPVLHDDAGNIVILEYSLASKSPLDFDLDRLRLAWDEWRGSSTIAS